MYKATVEVVVDKEKIVFTCLVVSYYGVDIDLNNFFGEELDSYKLISIEKCQKHN